MLTTRCGLAAGAVACILFAGIFAAIPALGQFTDSHRPDEVSQGDIVNVFTSWEGAISADGFIVAVPIDWVLEGVSVHRRGYHPVSLDLQSESGGRIDVRLEAPLKSTGEMVLRLRSPAASSFGSVEVVPYTYSRPAGGRLILHGERLELEVHSSEAHVDPDRFVLSFAEAEASPLVMRADVVPTMDLDREFAASFWMKSTGLNEIVMSTWDGDERHEYPFELVVGPSGRLRCFRGRPGEHQSMGSRDPIADGAWHHVVLTNEPDAGWMRLQIDGRTVDSLYSATPLHIGMQLSPAVGGRVPGTDPYFDAAKPYSGLLDAVEFRGYERDAGSARAIAGSARASKTIKVAYDDTLPEDMLAEPARGVRLVPSHRNIRPPVDGFRAVHEGGVVILLWSSRGSPSEEFVVERSRDGRRFDALDRIRRLTPSGDYEYRDLNAGEGVAFYRLRQVDRDGAERVSATIKVGMGAELPEQITLVGNFPNPFNGVTTIGYVVTEQTDIRLSVWDVSGQSVRTLVDRRRSPGYYEVQFEAGDLPSGTYFVRVESRAGTQSHKMILMR